MWTGNNIYLMIIDVEFIIPEIHLWNRIDENADGIVSQDELAKWIKFTQTRFDQRSQIQWAYIQAMNSRVEKQV